MPYALVLMPQVGTGTKADPFRPKYFKHALRLHGEAYEVVAGILAVMCDAEQSVLDQIAADPECRVVTNARFEAAIPVEHRERIALIEERVRSRWAARGIA